jgi:hypothetical protein
MLSFQSARNRTELAPSSENFQVEKTFSRARRKKRNAREITQRTAQLDHNRPHKEEGIVVLPVPFIIWDRWITKKKYKENADHS